MNASNTLTVQEIRVALSNAGKPVSRETLYVYFRRFKIKPLGVLQVPRRYPDDVPDKILQRLGLSTKRNGHAKAKGKR